MINPMKFMQVKSMLATLKQNHPKFPSFLDAVSKRALCKDTIIEIKVTTPDGESLESNLRLKESDLEVLRQIMLQKLFYGIRHSIRFIAFCHILCHFFNLRFRIFHCNRRFEVHRKH